MDLRNMVDNDAKYNSIAMKFETFANKLTEFEKEIEMEYNDKLYQTIESEIANIHSCIKAITENKLGGDINDNNTFKAQDEPYFEYDYDNNNEYDNDGYETDATDYVYMCDTYTDLFLKSNWYEEPAYFYKYAKYINIGNINILMNIVNNLPNVFCCITKQYTIKNYDKVILYDMQHIEMQLIIDIIKRVGYHVDIPVDLEAYGHTYTFATVYLYHIYKIAQNQNDIVYEAYMNDIYYEGLRNLRDYISNDIKEKAYNNFVSLSQNNKKCCNIAMNNFNEIEAIYYNNLANMYDKFAKLFKY